MYSIFIATLLTQAVDYSAFASVRPVAISIYSLHVIKLTHLSLPKIRCTLVTNMKLDPTIKQLVENARYVSTFDCDVAFCRHHWLQTALRTAKIRQACPRCCALTYASTIVSTFKPICHFTTLKSVKKGHLSSFSHTEFVPFFTTFVIVMQVTCRGFHVTFRQMLRYRIKCFRATGV